MSAPKPIYDPDQVDASWLDEVLGSAGVIRGSIRAATAEPIGTGQVGCNIRYRLTYSDEGAGPASVVGKFASRDAASQAAGIQTRTFETEVAFYRDLAETVDISRPQCFYASIEPGTADVVLLLEDIDGVAGDQLTGCSLDQAVMAVEQAARLHGPRWGDPRLGELKWLADKHPQPITPGPVIAMMWPTFVDRYGDRLTEESHEVGARLGAAGTWVDPRPGDSTVCHCDYRLDNMLFGPAGSARPLTVVDWQTAQLGIGTSDVSYFISAAVDPETRRTSELDLVRAYHRALGDYDTGRYSFDACWEDYRRHSFSGFFMAVFASILVQRTERGDAMFLKMANGAASQIVDLDAFEFLA